MSFASEMYDCNNAVLLLCWPVQLLNEILAVMIYNFKQQRKTY